MPPPDRPVRRGEPDPAERTGRRPAGPPPVGHHQGPRDPERGTSTRNRPVREPGQRPAEEPAERSIPPARRRGEIEPRRPTTPEAPERRGRFTEPPPRLTRAGRSTAAGDPEDEAEDDDRSLGMIWAVFIGQILGAAAAGLALWLGCYKLWDRWPYGAAGAAALVLFGMLLGGQFHHRHKHPDEPLDLVTLGVILVVGLVLTVSPAAFVLRPI